ncbi:MAG: type II toxin-antitoxin system VapC family toxin [Synergistaceae bacterium]|jgi:tRNA(fMet)-specific endonuclease VapC|nr:type II toxin-antitoxin system VapC family toxin [Synergistaceae bacterium]
MPETYMLDTDICSYIIRDRPPRLKKAFLEHEKDAVCISAVTYAELLYGLEKKPSEKLERDISEFVILVKIVDWNYAAAQKYAKIRHYLTANGRVISDFDMQIAAAALAMNAKLITNNKKHFGMVPELALADWLL